MNSTNSIRYFLTLCFLLTQVVTGTGHKQTLPYKFSLDTEPGDTEICLTCIDAHLSNLTKEKYRQSIFADVHVPPVQPTTFDTLENKPDMETSTTPSSTSHKICLNCPFGCNFSTFCPDEMDWHLCPNTQDRYYFVENYIPGRITLVKPEANVINKVKFTCDNCGFEAISYEKAQKHTCDIQNSDALASKVTWVCPLGCDHKVTRATYLARHLTLFCPYRTNSSAWSNVPPTPTITCLN